MGEEISKTRGVYGRCLPSHHSVSSGSVGTYNNFDEEDHRSLLETKIKKLLVVRNKAIEKESSINFNNKLKNRAVPILPPSHRWENLDERLLYFIHYIRYVNLGVFTDNDLITGALSLEIQHEQKSNLQQDVYDQLIAESFGKTFQKHRSPPPIEKPIEVDEDTRQILEKHKVKEKIGLYFISLSKEKESRDKAFSDLILAYTDTISDLSIPLNFLYQAQEESAKKHWILEWMQDNHFPSQYGQLFGTLYNLLNLVRESVKNRDFDKALRMLATAENLVKYLFDLFHEYYSEKVKKISRPLRALLILKNVAKGIVVFVIFKNVKGFVPLFTALFSANIANQFYDKKIGLRADSVNIKEAGIDTGLDLLTLAVSQRITNVFISKYGVSKDGIPSYIIQTIAGDVINSITYEIRHLGDGAGFAGFLQNLYNKFSDPDKWVTDLIMLGISKSYREDKVSARMRTRGLTNFRKLALTVPLLAISPNNATGHSTNTPQTILTTNDGTTSQNLKSTSNLADANRQNSSVSNDSLSKSVSQSIPIQQNRGLGNNRYTYQQRSSNPPSNTPFNSNSGPVMGMAVIAGRRRNRKFEEKLSEIENTLKELSDGVEKTEINTRLNNIKKNLSDKTITQRKAMGQLEAVFNTIKENIAVQEVDNLFRSNKDFFRYSRIVKKVKIPIRGEKGPSILDLVYYVETIKNGKKVFEYVVFEVKFGQSRLSFGQFTAIWFKSRIAEIRQQSEALAKDIETSWKEGRVSSYLIKIKASRQTSLTEYTNLWNKNIKKSSKK